MICVRLIQRPAGMGFNVVLTFQPINGNCYRQEVALCVGEEYDVEIVARAVEVCARRIALAAKHAAGRDEAAQLPQSDPKLNTFLEG